MMHRWTKKNDSGAVRTVGNGRVLVYGMGLHIEQLICSPYSAPSMAQVIVEDIESCES